jgi:metal-dependent hydrolase (beta-lactamase superfamily II)
MENSHFHITLGDFKCIAIRDGGQNISADFLFANAPPEELNTVLQNKNLERDQLRSMWTCLLVDTGRVKLLVDTGYGSGEPRGGNLLPQLEWLGYQPGDIDMVFLTHAHPDHLGGCAGEDDDPVFTHARYMIDEREVETWMAEQD